MERPAYITRCPVCLALVEIKDVYEYEFEYRDKKKVQMPFDVDRLVQRTCRHDLTEHD